MPNLKIDLVNKLNNDRYYEEIELVRLAQEPNMNYKEKIDLISEKLLNISILNAQIGLVNQYFQDQPVAQPNTVPSPTPAGHVHPGQSHGEQL